MTSNKAQQVFLYLHFLRCGLFSTSIHCHLISPSIILLFQDSHHDFSYPNQIKLTILSNLNFIGVHHQLFIMLTAIFKVQLSCYWLWACYFINVLSGGNMTIICYCESKENIGNIPFIKLENLSHIMDGDSTDLNTAAPVSMFLQCYDNFTQALPYTLVLSGKLSTH